MLAQTKSSSGSTLDLLADIEVPITIRYARKRMLLGDLAALTSGSAIDLERPADAPVEMLVNGRVIARGQAVMVGGNSAIRITWMADDQPRH
jgi:flagellar motor switch protein FliN/FliY